MTRCAPLPIPVPSASICPATMESPCPRRNCPACRSWTSPSCPQRETCSPRRPHRGGGEALGGGLRDVGLSVSHRRLHPGPAHRPDAGLLRGGGVLVDRGCHRSVYHSMALLDLQPVYLPRPWLTEEGVTGPISPQLVDNELKNHPDIKTVCITSPTYYGVLSDIFAIAQVVHAHGGTLVVDGAHGAHLPFLGLEAYGGPTWWSARPIRPSRPRARRLCCSPPGPIAWMTCAGRAPSTAPPVLPIP